MYIHICIGMYIYIYTYTYVYIYREREIYVFTQCVAMHATLHTMTMCLVSVAGARRVVSPSARSAWLKADGMCGMAN